MREYGSHDQDILEEGSLCPFLSNGIKEIASGAKFVGDAENKLIKIISQLYSPFPIRDSIMVDVGANIGLFTKILCESFPDLQVHSFEPVDETRSWLKELKNKCPKPRNVIIHNEAVSDSDGQTVTLYGPRKQRKYSKSNLKPHNTGASMNSLVNLRRDSTTVLSETKTARIDTIFSNTVCIEFIKIDAEGNDQLVLLGLKNKLKNGSIKLLYWEFFKLSQAASGYSLTTSIRLLDDYSYSSYLYNGDKIILISGRCLDESILNGINKTVNILSILKTSIYTKIPDMFKN